MPRGGAFPGRPFHRPLQHANRSHPHRFLRHRRRSRRLGVQAGARRVVPIVASMGRRCVVTAPVVSVIATAKSCAARRRANIARRTTRAVPRVKNVASTAIATAQRTVSVARMTSARTMESVAILANVSMDRMPAAAMTTAPVDMSAPRTTPAARRLVSRESAAMIAAAGFAHVPIALRVFPMAPAPYGAPRDRSSAKSMPAGHAGWMRIRAMRIAERVSGGRPVATMVAAQPVSSAPC